MAMGVASANEHEQATTSTAAVASGSRLSKKVSAAMPGHDRADRVAAEAVGSGLDAAAPRLGLLDHADDLAEGRVGADLRRADAQVAELGDGGRVDAAARARRRPAAARR